ncbi:MAG: NAD-dependent epimerase/dehydratase family protein [Myxococcota bacterium]
MSAPTHILITGGAGFIGANLAERFLSLGHTVTVMDVAPFARLNRHDRLTCIKGDVSDEALVDRLVSKAGRVVHLAAVVGVDEYMTDPALVLDVNVFGTRNVLRACMRHGRPVLFTSSSEIYGTNPEVLEERSPRTYGSYLSPRWSYALSKAVGEQYAQAYAPQGLEHVSIRYFNIYGPGLDRPGEGRVISKFIGHIQKGTPLPLVDGGDAVRAYCYVTDAMDATAQLALAVGQGSTVNGRAFNVGRVEPVSVKELAERMIALTGHSAGVVEVPGEDFFGKNFEDIPRRVPDVSALRDALGFEATIDLDDGLRRTLGAFGLLR